jgi:hypothetical protein
MRLFEDAVRCQTNTSCHKKYISTRLQRLVSRDRDSLFPVCSPCRDRHAELSLDKSTTSSLTHKHTRSPSRPFSIHLLHAVLLLLLRKQSTCCCRCIGFLFLSLALFCCRVRQESVFVVGSDDSDTRFRLFASPVSLHRHL